jgi:hypothetical protein
VAARKRTWNKEGRPARAGSWIALLAAATLGDRVDMVRAEVKADGLAEVGSYRLVVQSYDAPGGPAIPGSRRRPRASVQRDVTAEELRDGVRIPVMLVGESPKDGSPSTFVAWVEAGSADLEFDGRAARPSRGSVYGVTTCDRDQSTVRISLDRKVAA